MQRTVFVLLGLLTALAILTQPLALAQPARAPRDPAAAVEQIRRERGPIAVQIDSASGTPTLLRGQLWRSTATTRDAERTARAFFGRYGAAWGLAQPDQELRLTASSTDQLGYTSLRFGQRSGGLPVFDTDLRVQVDPSGVLSTINGQLLPEVQPTALIPRLDRAAAERRAQALAGGSLQRAPQLGVLRVGGQDRLAWEVWLVDPQLPARWQLRLDALDGALLSQLNALGSVRDRRTYNLDGGTSLPGTIARTETITFSSDPEIDAAHTNAGRVYNYFWTTFGRDSIDGQGLPIVSSVHYGSQYNNAFWLGGDGDSLIGQMVYGDGDGVRFAPLARALDVVAHELTHGVTEYTARLGYYDQPGALNEGFSDIFGLLVDPANWQIGEDVYTPGIAGDALRAADDPTRYGDPAVWGEYLRTTLDNGGIHSNSGIFAHLAYQLGTTIGRDKTAQIFYRTLTQKLTFSSDLPVAKDLTIQACEELIGSYSIDERDCADVRVAFVRAGIGIPSRIAPRVSAPSEVFLPVAIARSDAQPRLSLPPLPACGSELIRNGGFEQGQTGWVTDAGSTTIDSFTARSGGSSSRLNASYQLLQFVRLPEGAQTATVRFHLLRSSVAEPAQPTMFVRAETTDGQTLATLATLTGTDPVNQWLSYEQTLDVSALRDLRLIFADRYGTHHLDDISITCVGSQ